METTKRYPLDVGTRHLWIALALIFCISEAFGASIVHRQCFDTDAFNLELVTSPDGSESYSRIYWSGLDKTAEVPGSPELPTKYIHMLVPADACNFSVALTDVSLNGSSILKERMYPVQVPVSINEYDPNTFTCPDMSKYDGWESNVHAEFVSEAWIEGRHHIVTICLYPVAYSSGTNQLQLCSEMTVELQYEQSSSPFRMNHGILDSMPSIADISKMVVNSDALDNGMMKASSSGLSYSDRQIRYYIISERNLLPAVRDLVALKSQKGYKVITKAIEDIYTDIRYKIGSCAEIVDEAASLKCYLRDEFEENGAFFCLLIGDHKTKLPIRKGYYKHEYNDPLADEYNGSNYIPTDFYFSDLMSGDWDANKDEFGNISVDVASTTFNPCIYVGRLLCHSKEQLKNYISKLICYELNPGRGDTSYLDKSAVVVQYGLDYGRKNIIDEMNSTFNSVNEIFDAQMNGSNDIYPTGNDVVDIVQNSGYCSLIGHGEPTTIACYGKPREFNKWEYISALEGYNHINGETQINHIVTNNGLNQMTNYYSPGVVYSLACEPASFDILAFNSIVFDVPHTVASSYTCGGLYGGVAFLGNTRAGFLSDSPFLEKSFLKSLENNPKTGVAEAMSKMLYSNNGNNALFLSDAKYVGCTHNLIGDPEFEIWKYSPSKINSRVAYLNEYVSVTTQEYVDWAAVIYDGKGNSESLNSAGLWPGASVKILHLPYIGAGDKMQSVGVFGTGLIPTVTLQCASQDLTDVNKTFVVTEAKIGSDAESKDPVIIGKNANVYIRAADNITCKSNVIVEDAGRIELKADNEVSMAGSSINKGGLANISSKQVTCTAGFSVQKGATLSINKP